MSDVPGKFYIGQIRRSGTSGSSPGFLIGEADPPDPVNPPGSSGRGAGAGLSLDDNGDIQLGKEEYGGNRFIDLTEWEEGGFSDLQIGTPDFNLYAYFYQDSENRGFFIEAVTTNPNNVSSFISADVDDTTNLATSELRVFKSGFGTTRLLITSEDEPVLQDGIHQFGLKYISNYFTNGSQNDRWIPDWGAVKGYVDSNFPEWSERENNTVLFDKNYIIGNDAARTGNILFDFTGAKLGAETEMRHADASAFTFPAEAMLMFDTADISTTEDNYFLFVLTDKTASSEVVKVFHALEGGL